LNFIFAADIYNSRADVANSSDNSGFSLIWFRKRRYKGKKKKNKNPEMKKNEKYLNLELKYLDNELIIRTIIETFFTKKL
jgi:hypothetical protein